ncbi:MAG: VWA domain-containing protein [Pseudomonadota bacterium]
MNTINGLLSNFHFLRPLWLLALPILWGFVVWLAKRHQGNTQWANIIDGTLLPELRLDNASEKDNAQTPWRWLALAWSLTALALAGPCWERYPSQGYRDASAWVIVLDLSPSMNATDVSPNRTTRARYAINDILDAAQDARVGLIVFSQESHTVTPLTDDVATVRNMLSSLTPGIMPVEGDNLSPALEQAEKLLQQAGVAKGHIVVLSDGFSDPSSAFSTAERLRSQGTSIDVVGIGTENGAPLRKTDGGFVQDAQGKPILTHIDTDRLQRLTATGGGQYNELAQLPALIQHLQNQADRLPGTQQAATQGMEGTATVDHWRDAGSWLLPPLLIVAAFLFRRGWLG